MVFAYEDELPKKLFWKGKYFNKGASNDIRNYGLCKSHRNPFRYGGGIRTDSIGWAIRGRMFERKYYSERTGKEIDDVVRKIIKTQYQTWIF